MTEPIYLDYNATTPVDPRVLEAMLPYLRGRFGNPSSAHAYGREAQEGVDRGREQVAGLLGASPEEIVFTGGGSEADNLAIKGVAEARQDRGDHIITQETEHPAVLATCRYLERRGFSLTYLPVDRHGMVEPQDVAKAITCRTVLITIMHANNETGSVQPIGEIGRIARAHDVLMHTDAAQSVGKIPVRIEDLNVDLLTIAGHKLYAPKGVGALYVRRGVRLEPLIHGAGHESGRRAGTESVAAIAGLGEACRIAAESLAESSAGLRGLRERLHAALLAGGTEVRLNGHPTDRLPNTLNVSFVGLDGNALLAAVPEIAASTASACHSGRSEPSPVLLAMQVPPDVAIGAVRLSLGRWTTPEEVDRAAALMGAQIARR